MNAKFNYQGYNDNNSFLNPTSHEYSFTEKKYLHDVPQSSCPTIYNSNCRSVGNKFYFIAKKKGNIIYQSKQFWRGNNLEVFWYNDFWVYDFLEPAFSSECPININANPVCFHNFYHQDTTIDFPYRGFIWFKRFFTSGEEINVPQNHILYYRIQDGILQNYGSEGIWPASLARAILIPSWDGSELTWNNQREYGSNLPYPMEVVILETLLLNPKFKERYYYGRYGDNIFGLIRYDHWEDAERCCGSSSNPQQNCPGIVSDTDPLLGTLVLVNYSNFTLLERMPEAGIEQIFMKSFYSAPALEKSTSAVRLTRGAIFVTSGETAEGQKVFNN